MTKAIKILTFSVYSSLAAVPSSSFAQQYPETNPIVIASRKYGLEVELLLAVAQIESNFRTFAINASGKASFPKTMHEAVEILSRSGDNVDLGLFQINYKAWGGRLGYKKEDLLDPYVNSMVAARILKGCINRHGTKSGLSCYNTGTATKGWDYADGVLRVYEQYRNNKSKIKLSPGPQLKRKR